MRALVFKDANLTLERDYPLPTPAAGEALIRVLRAGICNTDLEIVRGYLGFQGVLGHEFVGVVEEIYGDDAAKRYAHLKGQRVTGDINAACYQADCAYCQRGMTTHCPQRTTLGIVGRDGAFADYLMLPVENLYPVDAAISNEEAVFVEPLAANFEIFEQVHIKPTDSIAILGDGKMGQLAAQVLTLSGCEVLMIGKHEDKLDLAAQRGVRPHVLKDAQSFALAGGRRVDVVVECTGTAQGLEMAMRLTRPRGTLVLKSTVADKSTLDLAPIVIDEIRVQGSRCGPFAPALRALSLKTVDVLPLISASYTLDDGLAAFEKASQRGILKVQVDI
ncbi:alcohol dehydrogenase [Ktedonosporobacter rubrisoli]|uniref:Alcohol dehydrogenase n=1 Tax=Ktedonosporobacter rubrisoli TaxID=2509675 RepID=A0A4V0YZY9_KTERU|nr:alcohol dehydrogenase catalytic domain-containing protein [Ktedonosporobacter rubrisoli]QBD81381.1 alcohol dehydrogenase [Ktedonosporobacter rubrisoli]